jgi:hypothetical protein
MRKKNGRPAKDFNWHLLYKLLSLNLRQIDCGEILNVSIKTIERRIKKLHNCTFDELRNKKMSYTRQKLINKALTMADTGNATMLIFCLKNLCAWEDSPDNNDYKNTEYKKVINLNYSVPINIKEGGINDEGKQC